MICQHLKRMDAGLKQGMSSAARSRWAGLHRNRTMAITIVGWMAVSAASVAHSNNDDQEGAAQEHIQGPFDQEVPAAAFTFRMLPIPGDDAAGLAAFHMSRNEITWEAFDVFVYQLDVADAQQAGADEADAVTRPSKPYLPPDRGFGHEGFAAISMSHRTATEFCRWLSKTTGRTYRLPTEKEWEHACRAGSTSDYGFSGDAKQLGDYAWFDGNAGGAPQAVASKKPNAWGLYDMHGNVAEWCDGTDGKPVTRGGSYRDSAEKLVCTARALPQSAWNASDPQVPKSQWWLADAPFVGFRVVCEMKQETTAVEPPSATTQPAKAQVPANVDGQ
jgi:formylglycine-generating enzyme required for sulfatase activity